MNAHKLSRRTFYLAAVVAIIASTSGFALASVLSPATTVTQSASFYQGSNVAVAGYDTPTLAVGASPGTCSPSTVTDGTTGGSVNLVLSAYTGGTNCTMYDFSEIFTVDYFSASTTTHVDNFTIYSQFGAGTVQTSYVHLQLGTASPGTFSASIQVVVDYGPMMPPTGGITNLELIIHHP
ncbi:MAG TPA: hypothetical protein VML94_00090 [Thermoplasmata archaeon]|nr:hypothetical protein [Thermoplasmata archaeon]